MSDLSLTLFNHLTERLFMPVYCLNPSANIRYIGLSPISENVCASDKPPTCHVSKRDPI